MTLETGTAIVTAAVAVIILLGRTCQGIGEDSQDSLMQLAQAQPPRKVFKIPLPPDYRHRPQDLEEVPPRQRPAPQEIPQSRSPSPPIEREQRQKAPISDYSMTVRRLVRLIEHSSEPARQEMNRLYISGEAMAWMRIAAEQGDPDAQFALGRKYHLGKAGPADYVKAMDWYLKSAAQGCAGAACNLGYMYFEGKGVPKDHSKACEWFRQAEDQDDDARRMAARRCGR